jgi:glycosyltransferase involved in cell wall biosynthesis
MRAIYRRVPLVTGLPKNKRSLIYIGNLVDAIVACLAHPSAKGKTYLVSDSEAVSTADLIRKIGQALGRSSLLLPCPRIIFRFGAWLFGRGKEANRLLGSLEVDSSLIRKEVGWSPSTSLQEGLKITAEWFRFNKGQKLEIEDQKPRICFIMTSPFTYAAFIAPHVKRLVEDFAVTVSFNDQESAIVIKIPVGARFISMPIVREIAPLKDLIACWKYYKYFREQRFDAILSLTPKGGMVAMLAARLACVPSRTHCFTGQVWATRKGIARFALKSIDKVIALVASQVLVDSESQRRFLVNSGVLSESKGHVLGAGSVCGVDTGRFRPDPEARRKIRGALGLSESDICILFVGRIKQEKGVIDLVSAFQQLMPLHPNLHLLLVGPDEEGLIPALRKLQRIHYVGYTGLVNEYMAGSDMLCLPSYREGFGSVLIEAGACGLPTVASSIYGVTDAVVENETGLLHPPHDVETIAKKIKYLIYQILLQQMTYSL